MSYYLLRTKMYLILQTIFVFLLLFKFGHAEENCTSDELVMVQMLLRHGSQSPPIFYPNNPNPILLWNEGLDDLTMVGKFQSFSFGYFIRQSLHDFITSDPTEVEVMSSPDKVCVKTAQSFVSALYYPTKQWEVIEGFPWQPIYISYEKKDTDKYLSKSKCLAADTVAESLLAEESEIIMQDPEFQNLIELWELGSGYELRNLRDIRILYASLEIEARYNLTIPDWAAFYWDKMKYLNDLTFSLGIKPKIVHRLRGGPLLGLTIDAMKKKACNETNKKVMVYTTHGYMLAAFLSAMGMHNGQTMPLGTAIFIQLYKHDDEFYVKYLFMNSTTSDGIPKKFYPLTVPGCTEFCPLEYVIEKTEDIIPENWEEECQHV